MRYFKLDMTLVPLAPLTPETKHLINSNAIAQMSPATFIINTGRGSVADEQAVAHALETGRLAGYAADVFEMEDWAQMDRPGNIPESLLKNTKQTFFTPHLGSAAENIRKAIAMDAARNIFQALGGKKPQGAINNPHIVEAANCA